MYIPISKDGVPFYSEGYVVRFYKKDGTSWVANFNTGWANFSGIYDFPEFERMVIFAFGQCYIMKDDEQNPLKIFGVHFTNVCETDDNMLILPNPKDITIIEISTDKVWCSKRISRSGFDNLNFSGDFVAQDDAFDIISDDGEDFREWKSFSFNYKTKKITSCAYQFPNNAKPWWQFW